jgi:tRNA threonylcarbamoyladenosine biosynthesis protein TsaE
VNAVQQVGDVVVDAAELSAFAIDGEVVDESALRSWARALGASVPLPIVITLDGPLGAGKTTVAQGIGEGAGVAAGESITSPTFSLVHEHITPRGPLAHLDLYRLSAGREVDALGLDALIERHALVVIEWSDRAASLLAGRRRLAVELDYVDADDLSRRLLRSRVVSA